MFLSACGFVNYEELSDQGRFKGSVLVLWVGENETGAGDGKFIYVPFPGRELVFVRDTSANPEATIQVIQPEPIYTDGGSIPRGIQPLRGFSPWGYAPAYMIHDWLFVARRCLRDGEATEEETKVSNMEFIESAEIMGEAIKALIAQQRVAQNDVAPFAISATVAGPVSRGRWNADGECVKGMDRLTDEHREEVEKFRRERSGSLKSFGVRSADRTRDGARVVAVVEF